MVRYGRNDTQRETIRSGLASDSLDLFLFGTVGWEMNDLEDWREYLWYLPPFGFLIGFGGTIALLIAWH